MGAKASLEQIQAAEAVLKPYISDPAISLAALALEVVNAYLDCAKPRARQHKNGDEPEGFAAFYAAYPRKVARQDAANAYRGAITRASAEAIRAGLDRYIQECAGKEIKFVAHPATWLRQGRWSDQQPQLAVVAGTTFEDASPGEWNTRLEIFFGLLERPLFTWNDSWGLHPFHPDTKTPKSVKRTFQSQNPDMDFVGLKALHQQQSKTA